ncbi:MAG: carboxylating nicotinate-nucleotide diphosphorylase [bacterium]
MELGLDPAELDALLRRALAEDLGAGDCTTLGVGVDRIPGKAVIEAQQPLVVAGLSAATRVFALLEPSVEVSLRAADGDRVERGAELARIAGSFGTLLAGERVALNLLGHLSGIATLTRRFADAVAGTRAHVVDTRKTLPGLRMLAKYAVRMGGGRNHRIGLFDAVLIKNNHIDAAGGIAAALGRIQASGAPRPIEIEVRNLDELDQALAFDPIPDWILLDNFDLAGLGEAVRRTAGRALLEASGGMSLERVAAVAATGVDRISVGALTHSAPWADVHLVVARETRS